MSSIWRSLSSSVLHLERSVGCSLVDDIQCPSSGAIFHYNIKEWDMSLSCCRQAGWKRLLRPGILAFDKFLQTLIRDSGSLFGILIGKSCGKTKISAPPAPPYYDRSLLTKSRIC